MKRKANPLAFSAVGRRSSGSAARTRGDSRDPVGLMRHLAILEQKATMFRSASLASKRKGRALPEPPCRWCFSGTAGTLEGVTEHRTRSAARGGREVEQMTAAMALRLTTDDQIQPAITELFHRISRVLPADQEILWVPPDMKAFDAIRLMKTHGFSQVPVKQGEEVLGIFSYRSFALETVILDLKRNKIDELPVEEFMQMVGPELFKHVTDEFAAIFDVLDRDGAALVGEPGRLRGIITAIDVLRYLYGVASPFVLLTEIEQSLRALIRRSVDEVTLNLCVQNSLKSIYKRPEDMPSRLEEMTFNDYVQVIGDGRNWERFVATMGGSRERTRAKLEEIRDLRNDVFHFKRTITPDDQSSLRRHRDWILMRSRAVEAQIRIGGARA